MNIEDQKRVLDALGEVAPHAHIADWNEDRDELAVDLNPTGTPGMWKRFRHPVACDEPVDGDAWATAVEKAKIFYANVAIVPEQEN